LGIILRAQLLDHRVLIPIQPARATTPTVRVPSHHEVQVKGRVSNAATGDFLFGATISVNGLFRDVGHLLAWRRSEIGRIRRVHRKMNATLAKMIPCPSPLTEDNLVFQLRPTAELQS
jgi:hypothetical protein